MLQQFVHITRVITPYMLGAVLLLIYLAEHIFPQRKELIDRRHDMENMALGLLNLALAFGAGFYFQQLLGFTTANGFGLLQWAGWPFLAELIVGFVVIDLFMYWWHRINHVLPFFWRFHKYHHQDKKMNSTTAVRFHTGELILSYMVRIIVFPLLGISLAPVLLHAFILFPVIVFHHSNIKISLKKDLIIRNFIVTPQMHRVHHSIIKYDTDSNFSSILPIWDKLFKTYHKKADGPIEFGV
ncbi:MAG: sterol desaturase family protein [Chitinophagaceae bacterium]